MTHLNPVYQVKRKLFDFLLSKVDLYLVICYQSTILKLSLLTSLSWSLHEGKLSLATSLKERKHNCFYSNKCNILFCICFRKVYFLAKVTKNFISLIFCSLL